MYKMHIFLSLFILHVRISESKFVLVLQIPGYGRHVYFNSIKSLACFSNSVTLHDVRIT